MIVIGPKLEYYEHSDRIGSGSFGSVFLYKLKDDHCHDEALPRQMAVKMLIEKDELHQRETDLCHVRHNNVIKFHGVERERGAIYIKMEVANLIFKNFNKTSLRE